MENIKVRAWDTSRKKMWSAEELGKDQLTISPDGKGFINVNSLDARLSEYLKHLIPLLFIGTKDKDGKEIYDRDIIEWKWARLLDDGRTRKVGINHVSFCP